MALTTIPSELSSVSGIADSSDATAITIDSSENIGIGHTNPAAMLAPDVVIGATATNGGITIKSAATTHAAGLHFADADSGTDRYDGYIQYEHNNRALTLGTAAVERLRINSAGNVGIGATPKTWNSSWESLQIGERSVFFSQASTTTGIGENVYYDSGGWKAFATATGSLYQLSGGNHHFYTMASVSADATSSPSEKFTILNNGRVGIGEVSPDRVFHVKRSDSGGTVAKFENSAGTVYIELNTANQAGGDAGYLSYDSSKNLGFWTDDTQRVTIDSAGTLRVGNPASVPTPTNGWDANLDAIQVGEASAFRSGDSDYSAATVMSTNLYQTGGGDKLLNGTDYAAQYTQQGGNHYFYGYDNGSADAVPGIATNDLMNPVIIHKGGGISIGGGTVSNTANGKAGIFWHGNPQNGADYCIRRTNDAWSGSNYAQLLIDWDTGVKIDTGNEAYGKSYLEVNGPITTFADGYTTHDYDDLSNATTRGISVNLHPSLAVNGSAIAHCDDARNLGIRALVHQSTTQSTNRPTGYGTIWCDQHYYSDLNKGGKYVMQKCVGHSSTPLEYRRNTDTSNGTSWSSWYTVDHTITSDVRAKKNIVDAPDQLENLKKIRVREFDFINDLDPNAQLGMIAQELDTTLPEYVWKQYDKDTGEVLEDLMWRIRYKDMIPMLIKSIQEQQTLIETLQTKVAALEAK